MAAKPKKMDDDTLLELVKKYYAQRETRKKPMEDQWFLNRMFYQGIQDWQPKKYDADGREINNEEGEYYTDVVVNLILPTCVTIISQLTKNRPTITAVPATTDPDDQDKARFTEKVITYLFDKTNISLKLHEFLLNALLCGISFAKVLWDEHAGPKVESIRTERKSDGGGDYMYDSKLKNDRIGEVAIHPVSAFNILPNAHATSLDDCQWLLHYYLKDFEQLKFQYPQLTAVSDVGDILGFIDQSINQNSFGGVSPDDGVLVKELYQKPTVDYPKGLYVKIVGDQVLEKSEMDQDDWPWVAMPTFDNPGSFWPESMVTHLNAINAQLNFHVDHMLSYVDNVVNSPIIIYPGGGLTAEQITNSPTAIWPVTNKDLTPDRLLPAPLPDSMFGVPELLKGLYEEVSRIGKPLKGQNVPGGRSGAVINMLQEADLEHLVPIAVKLEEFLLGIVKKALLLVKENYSEDRMIRVVGENRAPWVAPFKRDLIIDEDLRVQMFSSLPRSKASQQQFLLELATQTQLIDPQRHSARIFRAFDLGTMEVFSEDMQADEEEVQRENDLLISGEGYPEVKIWQNHEAHLECHLRLFKSNRFKQAEVTQTSVPGKGKAEGRQLTIGELATQHFLDHQNQLKKQQMEALMMQMQIKKSLQGGEAAQPIPQGGE